MDQACCDSKMNLDEVSCPFSWGMQKVVEGPEWHLVSSNMEKRHDNLKDLEDEFPESVLMFHLMIVYEQVLRDDLCSVRETLEQAEKSLDVITENRSTSESARVGLKHIFIGTKCNAYKKLNGPEDIETLLKDTRSEKDLNEKELAVVYGCQCLAWSFYRHAFVEKAILSAVKAIEYEPDNGKWHFLLGKNKRRQRKRLGSYASIPDSTEKSACETAWDLSRSALIGVSLARMYRDSRDYDKAENIYAQVFRSNPTSCEVRLQLALGFIRAQQAENAKKCLDYVAERMPNLAMYLHYMAIYHQKCTKDMKTACFFFQRTTEQRNYIAELDYVECRMNVDRNFEPLTYLLSLLEKYADEPENILQDINIGIGSCHLFHRNDIVSASKYYMEAMKINPKNTSLMKHCFLVPGRNPINIYEVLTQKVESASRNVLGNYDSHQLALFREIQEMCLKHGPKPDKSNRSKMRGSRRNNQSNSSSASMSQSISRPNKGARGDRSANASHKADVPANELLRIGLSRCETWSE